MQEGRSTIPYARMGEAFLAQITNNRILCHERHCDDVATIWFCPKWANALDPPIPMCMCHWIESAGDQVKTELNDVLARVIEDVAMRDCAVDDAFNVFRRILINTSDINVDEVDAEERALAVRRKQAKKRLKISQMLQNQ